MSRIDHSMEARDTTRDGDFNDVVLTDEPISQSEIEELLYSEAFPREERLEKLRDLRDTLRARESADTGNDSFALMSEIDRSIEELENGTGESLTDDAVDHNPEDHSETMSPDSDEYLDRVEREEASLHEPDDATQQPLDEAEWDDGDGFDPSKGVG